MNYDIKVNSVWLSSIGASLFERRLPVLPETEENTVKLANTDGVIDFGSTYGPRQIELTLNINVSPGEYHRTLAQLARIFNAKRGELTIEFSDMPGKYYRAVYNGTLAPDSQVGSRLVHVALKMNDPWPTGAEKVTEVTITRSPQAIPIESSADVRAEPVIVMTNTGSTTVNSFKITNEYVIN